jgi:hypothetical protein
MGRCVSGNKFSPVLKLFHMAPASVRALGVCENQDYDC